ncbi:MAG: 50S ribosomal protein L9 [Bacteroidales bacterium]|jgi:large subunit ribosomal protein L9|nr:50S ribosomal protein L9 [Bacteroidales bacterium]MDD3201659.1 50S ribosomal protein L9 [Bacteroidales bacterium]
MEIILKQDVKNLGHKDDIVVVKDGYGANFLIPQGMAIMATPTAKKIHAENMKQRAHKEAKIREDAEALAAKLEGITVKVATKVSSTGKIFGSINNIQVADALAAMGHEVDRKNITIIGEENIKEVGTYDAVIKCYRETKANIKIEVVGEE